LSRNDPFVPFLALGKNPTQAQKQKSNPKLALQKRGGVDEKIATETTPIFNMPENSFS
jgi:hypothetical protein